MNKPRRLVLPILFGICVAAAAAAVLHLGGAGGQAALSLDGLIPVSPGSGDSGPRAAIAGVIGDAALVFALLSLFLLAMALILRPRRPAGSQSPGETPYLATFCALGAFLLVFTLSPLAADGPRMYPYPALFASMLMPPLLLLYGRSLSAAGRPVLGALAALVMAGFLAVTALLTAGGPIPAFLRPVILSAHLAAYAAVALVSIVNLVRRRRRGFRAVLTGLCAFGLLAAAAAASALLGGPHGPTLFRAGLAVFVLAAGFRLLALYGDRTGFMACADMAKDIPSGVCRMTDFESGDIVFANAFYYSLLGYTPEEARAAGLNTIYCTVLPEDLPAMKERIKKYFAISGGRFETECRHVKKDGEIIWALSRYTLDPDGGAITAVILDITQRKRSEERLRISEEENRIAIRHSNKMILRLDVKKRVCYRQPDIRLVFGLPAMIDNVPDSLIASGIIAHDSISGFRSFFEAIFRGEREGNVVVNLFDRSSGEFRWYHFDFTTIFDDNKMPAQAIISFYDITVQRQKELAFQRWQQSYNSIPKSSTNYFEYNLSDDLFEHEEGGMIPLAPDDVPRTLAGIAEYIATNHVVPDDIGKWLDFMSRDRLMERYAGGQFTDKTEFRRMAEAEECWTSLSVQLISDPYSSDVKGYFLLEDINDHKQAELFLQERSMRDSLTGLLNRGSFVEHFNEILHKSDPETQHALIMIDIDNFKTINDTLGHTTGDALLVSIANKLRYALRSDDLCGRLGGDEFVIGLKHMNYGKPLEARVNDLCSLICSEQIWGVTVSASFGIAGFPYDGLTFDELYKKADIALYKAKAQGRGGFALYDPQLSFDDMAAAPAGQVNE